MENKLMMIEKSLVELLEELTEKSLGRDEYSIPFADLGVDSLMALEMAVHLEREFDVSLGEEELKYVNTIAEVLAVVQAKVKVA